jgi:DNA-binding Lrp family transcriptional regulator
MAQFDETDRRLLDLLQKDARQTNKELADAIGIAQSTCLERVRALRARGVITGYRADLDLALLGRSIQALLMVRLAPKTTASVRAFQRDMLKRPETLSVSTVTGADDFVVRVGVPDVLHLRDFILEHVTSRKDVVDARASIVYERVRPATISPMD